MLTILRDSLHVRPWAAESAAFIAANSVTNNLEVWSLHYRVVFYKKAGIWSKMIGVYPMVKDVATCKKNLKELTGTYNLVEQNANVMSYSISEGIGFNGNYLSTVLVGNPAWGARTSQSAGFWSTYAETNNTDTDIGLWGGVASDANRGLRFGIRKGNTSISDLYGSNSRASYTGETTGIGLFSLGYNDSSINAIWKNGVSMGTGSNNGVVGSSALHFGINAGTSGAGASVPTTTKKYGMFYIASRLTAAEHLAQYEIEAFIASKLRV